MGKTKQNKTKNPATDSKTKRYERKYVKDVYCLLVP